MSDKPKVNQVKRAYQSMFLAPNGDIPEASKLVLADLAKFCAAGTSPRSIGPIGIDTNATMMMLGRQEVWYHINRILGIPERDVVQLAIPPRDAGTAKTDE
jgi:hypothetical protein